MPDGLTWQVTGLWYPDTDNPGDFLPVEYYGQIADPQDGQVTIPRNNTRLAQVTVSAHDPIITALYDSTRKIWLTHSRFLKVYYHDQLVFWGPWKLGDCDMAAETFTLYNADPSLRLIYHFLRRGDIGDTLNEGNDDKATVTVDHRGLWDLVDAARNTDGQTDRGVPDIGIDTSLAFNDVTPNGSQVMGVKRGDQVWNQILQLAQHDNGPDFDLEPVENTDGAYAKLNTYEHQGTDKSTTVAFHFGTGKQNLDNLRFTVGAKYLTHAHVLSRDLIIRKTVTNQTSSKETGPYVTWDATDFDANAAFTLDPLNPYGYVIDALIEYGQGIIKAYGRPLLEVTLDLPTETDDSYVYGVDYGIGDVVGVAGRVGLIDLEPSQYRIREVRLNQDGAGVKPEIDVIAERVAALEDEIGEEE